MGVWIVPAALMPALAAGLGYRRLRLLRARVQNAWLPLEARLGQRHDRIRDLLRAAAETTRSGSQELRSLTEAWRQALDAPGIAARGEAENELTHRLRRFFSDREESSGRTNPARLWAMGEPVIVAEKEIVIAAQVYNQQVMAWNQKIHQFPWSLIASVCRWQSIEYFVLDDPNAHAAPHVPI